MLHIPRHRLTYEFSPTSKPVARIPPGTTLVLETHDTSTGRIHRAEDIPAYLRVRRYEVSVEPGAALVPGDASPPGRVPGPYTAETYPIVAEGRYLVVDLPS